MLNTVGNCNTRVNFIFITLWDHSSYMRSVVDRNVVMGRMTVSCSLPLLYGVMISEWHKRTGRHRHYAFISFVCIKTRRNQTHVQAARDFLLVSLQNKWFGVFPEHDKVKLWYRRQWQLVTYIWKAVERKTSNKTDCFQVESLFMDEKLGLLCRRIGFAGPVSWITMIWSRHPIRCGM